MLSPTLIVLASALCHAGWNTALKRLERPRVGAVCILWIAFAGALVALWASGAALPPSRVGWRWAVAAGLCEGAYFATLAVALERCPLGIAYIVMRGGAMLGVWAVSVALALGRMTWCHGLGVAAVLLGLALVHHARPTRAAWGALGWAYLCALCIADYHLSYGQALAAGASSPGLFAVAMGIAALASLPLSGHNVLTAVGRCWRGF